MVRVDGSDLSEITAALDQLPVVSVAVHESDATDDHVSATRRESWDLVTDDPHPLSEAIDQRPLSAATSALVLRSGRNLQMAEALRLESFAYSMLQAGPEHQAWLSTRGRRTRTDLDHDRVEVRDHGDHLEIAMTRPRLFNLIDSAMRDQLVDAFQTVAHDTRPVRFVGRGRAFSGGGDPAEFGTTGDPNSAALIRLGLGVAPSIAAVAARLSAVIDGPCVGAGVELAAFAGSVIATRSASFKLPELSMGLIPGAGGTFSIPARIGARRTLEWLIRNTEINADTALAWGLVDRIVESAQ